VNVPNLGPKLLVWLCIALVLLVSLWLVTHIAHRTQRLIERYNAAVPEAGRSHWPPARVLWITWGIVALLHLIYALSMPVAYTPDSIGYYKLGQAFAQTGQLASINLIRTPGYPVFIAALIALFGSTALWIVVFQHLALSLLAPLTIWALSERVPLPIAIAAGVLAGLSPALSVTANLLWTESLFAVCATAALLVYIRRGETIKGLLLAGILVGFATMVRPTGVLILLSLLGWVLLCGWWNGCFATRQWFALVSCIVLAAGYLVTAGPWHMHLGLTRGTTDLSGGQASFTAWAAAVYQRRITADLAINQPDRAVWAMPEIWNNDPFVAFNDTNQMATGNGAANPHYFSEALAEAAEADPTRLRENRLDALIYNLTFQWMGSRGEVVWNELSWFLNLWNRSIWQPEVAAHAADGSLEQQLERMVYRWQPEQSPARAACIVVSLFVLQNWIWLAVPALISLLVLLMAPAGRSLVPGWLYWLGLVVSASALGMPVERYIVVAEPLIFIFLSVTLFILWNLGNRRSIQIDPAEQLVTQDYVESSQL
jgi:hypothetical protein